MMRKLADKKTVKLISLTVAAVFVLSVFGMAFTKSGFSGVASAAAADSAVGVVNYQMLVAQSPDMAGYRTAMQQEEQNAKTDFDNNTANMSNEEKQKYIYGKCPAPEFGTGFVYRQFSRCYVED